MRAMRLESVGNLFVREVEKPVPGPGDLLVKIEACGICGSDRHFFHGDFLTKPPVTIGHEFVGIIEALGSQVTGFAPGERVTGDPNIACGRCQQCLNGRVNACRNLQALGVQRDGGFAEYVLLPEKQALKIPLSLKAAHGAFCEPLACCLHGIDLAEIKAGSSVVVLGGGVIGLLVVQLARLAGATTLILSTRQASKRKLAEELGATHSVDPSASDIVAGIAGSSGIIPGGVDVVIECAGVAETVEQSTKLAKAGGTVVILGGMPKGEKVQFEPFDILHRELRILGSYINPFVHRRAADLVAAGAIELDKLISREITLEAAPDVIRHPPSASEVKVMVIPGRR